MIVTVGLIVVVAAGLMYLIDRDLKRAVLRQRRRAWLRAHPEYQRMSAVFVRMRIEIQDAFTPAMRRAAESAAELAAKLRDR